MEERIPFLLEPHSIPVSQTGLDTFEFQFPIPITDPRTTPLPPNDIVFCGKVISLQHTQPAVPRKRKSPFLLRSESFGELKSRQVKHSGSLRLPSTGENRCRRSSSSRKNNNGLFGILKFPLQMELSDIKMRQARREPVTLPKLPESSNGEPVRAQSCWELVRPLRRRGALAKALFGCFPLV